MKLILISLKAACGFLRSFRQHGVATTRGGRWRGEAPAREPSTCELARESRRRAVVPDCLCSSRVTGTCPCIRTVCNCHSPRGARARATCARYFWPLAPFFRRAARKNTPGRGGRGEGIFARRCPSATCRICRTTAPPPPPSPLLEVTWSLFSDRSANRPTRVPTRFTLRRTADAA